jgi:hypothetical protein
MKALVLALVILGILALRGEPVGAQISQNGPYYATPSWDQQIPAAQRFIVLSNWGNNAVLDRETGLVWEQDPETGGKPWDLAIKGCRFLPNVIQTRIGWRLPSIEELSSLVVSNGLLPQPNPFAGIGNSDIFWSASTDETDSTQAWQYQMGTYSPTTADKDNSARAWCVRGGQSVSNPPY